MNADASLTRAGTYTHSSFTKIKRNLAILLFRSKIDSFVCWKAESYHNTSIALLPLNFVYQKVFSFRLGSSDMCKLCTSMALWAERRTLWKHYMCWLVWIDNVSWHLSVNDIDIVGEIPSFDSWKRIFDGCFAAATLLWVASNSFIHLFSDNAKGRRATKKEENLCKYVHASNCYSFASFGLPSDSCACSTPSPRCCHSQWQ